MASQIDQRFHRIDVFVGEIAVPHDAGFQRDVQVHLDDLLQGEPVGLGLDLPGLVVQQQRAIAVEDLEAVPLRRIVAGGKRQAIGGASETPWRR